MEQKELTTEQWKDTYIYGDQYEVSNTGIVRNKNTGHILNPQTDNKGYLRVRLSLHDRKATAKVHRLVAIAFIPNPDNKPQVNHIDTNKKNNHVGNLEWATNGENQVHAYKTGLNYVTGRAGRKKIRVVKIDLKNNQPIEIYESIAEAGRVNSICSQNIEKVISGKRKTAGGFAWKAESEVMPYDEAINY